MAKGNHTIEVRALNDDSVQSLPIFAVVEGTGAAIDGVGAGWSNGQYLALAGALVVLILLGFARVHALTRRSQLPAISQTIPWMLCWLLMQISLLPSMQFSLKMR